MARLQTTGILDVQRRMATSGRLRFGDEKGERRPGRPLEFPRCTSPRRDLIEQIAELYGGEVREWNRDGRIQEWQVSCTGPIAVASPRGPEPLTQALERWKGPVCVTRCNGETCQVKLRRNRWSDPKPCECATKAGLEPGELDPRDRGCKPTTRFGLWIVGLRDAGVWLATTRSANAAAEVEVPLRIMQETGHPGWLSTVQERRAVPSADGEKETDTIIFRYPRIRIDAYADELQAIERGPEMAQLPGPSVETVPDRPALPAPTPAEVVDTEPLEGEAEHPEDDEPGAPPGAPAAEGDPPPSAPAEGDDSAHVPPAGDEPAGLSDELRARMEAQAERAREEAQHGDGTLPGTTT